MFEIITSLYTFWSYIEDANLVRKLFVVLRKYSNFLRWYVKNPEIKLKYCRIISTKTNDKTIEKIYESIIGKGKRSADDFLKTKTKFNFELVDSKLSYRITIDRLNQSKHNLIFESKYVSYYPLRNFKKLNVLTNEYNQIYEIISNPLTIGNSDYILFIEIDVSTDRNQLISYNKLNAEIVFKGSKIQITNFNGTEQGDFLIYIIMDWLVKYRNSKEIL